MVADAQSIPHALAAMELFRELPPSALAGVAACALVRRMPKDLRIFSQGDEGVRAHAVIKGGVRIAQSGSDGAQVIIRFIGPGEMFGTVCSSPTAAIPPMPSPSLRRWRRAGARPNCST